MQEMNSKKISDSPKWTITNWDKRRSMVLGAGLEYVKEDWPGPRMWVGNGWFEVSLGDLGLRPK